MSDRIKVLIVDDSRLFRAALEQAISQQPDVVVVGSVFNGAKAMEFIRATPPDVVTLDVEMPGMDGLATLQEIQQFNKSRCAFETVGVLMVSAFTRRGADVTMKALEAGAFDFVTKPSGPSPDANLVTLRDDLLPRIRACARRRLTTTAHVAVSTPKAAQAPVIRPNLHTPRTIRAIAIGVSTGGPRALSALLPDLCKRVTAPIIVVQHMPPGFTRSLAESLARQLQLSVSEASEGMQINSARVFIAPGGRHLVLRGSPGNVHFGINDAPPENGCRPSADVLFRSVAAVFGREALALILTGMGSDGTNGLRALHRAGAYIIAQDEATSVVWGMPGSAVEAGLADEVLPLSEIAGAAAAITTRTVANP